MRYERVIWLLGAFVGAFAAVLVVAAMAATGTVAGRSVGVFADLLGLAFVEGPRWLGPAIAIGSILAAGVIGGMAASRGRDHLFRWAAIGALLLVAGYVAWTFVWTVWRLVVVGALGAAPLLPLEAALLALAGLLLPAMLLFLPAAMLWAWIVGAVLKGWPNPCRGSSSVKLPGDPRSPPA